MQPLVLIRCCHKEARSYRDWDLYKFGNDQTGVTCQCSLSTVLRSFSFRLQSTHGLAPPIAFGPCGLDYVRIWREKQTLEEIDEDSVADINVFICGTLVRDHIDG